MIRLAGGPIVFADTVESSALDQIRRMAKSPAFRRPGRIRIMPDVHAGIGSCIGFTYPLEPGDPIVPNVIGVDIGCGVIAAHITDDDGLADHFDYFDAHVRRTIPSGFESRNEPLSLAHYGTLHADILRVCDEIGMSPARSLRQIGTLGGGNHFIEIGRSDVTGNLALIVHTGSRNFGLSVASYHQNIASRKHPEMGDLAYLDDDDAETYMRHMCVAQRYAHVNRLAIVELLIASDGYITDTIHNFIDDDGIIRKGAIAAHDEQTVVIPWNMRDGCVVGIGLGNEEWNFSAPHGAGRSMSRSEAKRNVDLESYKDAMSDVYSTCVNRGTIDESPMAYKNPMTVAESMAPTVHIIDHIRTLYNFKACGR